MTPDIEAELFAALNKAMNQITALNTDMVFDPIGKQAYVVVAFNHPLDPDLLPENASGDDVKAAISACTLSVMPYVRDNPEQQITNTQTLPHGVQAVAAAMMASILQQSGVTNVLQIAQQAVLEHRRKTDD